jgi:hypothetical protein
MRKISSLLVATGLVATGLVTGAGVFGVAVPPAWGVIAKSCVPVNLKVSLGTVQGTAGTIYHPIVFTNVGSLSCTIFGVPVIQPVRGAGHRAVGPLARNLSMGEMPAMHQLAEGQSVSVAFGVTETGNYTRSTCVPRAADGVVVSVGSFLHSRYVHLPIDVCTKRTSISTKLITAGTTGY